MLRGIFGKFWGLLVAICLIIAVVVSRLAKLARALIKGQRNIIRREQKDEQAREHFHKTLKEFIREFNKRK
ncbi:hypothetical protein [Borrelia sp. RT1S]|uniref:hypothetical protein n=1 Tax=Borrelia sp. RT1S TaxID=2898580 RepID=UPI001E43B6A3|nr:hypothetical protein [Borrelia sp. RT1S]UGQ17864.1 hypothetical protein LSO05_05380 [Borrelia sp. RT1S]